MAKQTPLMLLVPQGANRLVELLEDDDRIGERLSENGACAPLTRVALGDGRAIAFGLGHNSRNLRAEVMLTLWEPVHILLSGPVAFLGIDARQAFELVRLAQDPIGMEIAESGRGSTRFSGAHVRMVGTEEDL